MKEEKKTKVKDLLHGGGRSAQEHHYKPEGDLVLVDEPGLGHSLDEEHADDGEHHHLGHRREEHGHEGQPREGAGQLDAGEARPEEDERERDGDPAHEVR